MSDSNIDSALVDDATADVDTKADGGAQTDVDTGEGVDTADERGGNKEAAKYRRQLRDTEAHRDALSERLSTMQRREVERLAAEHLVDPADIWRDGAELAALLDDGGNLDAVKVAEAARATVTAHRHWAAPPTPKRHPDSRRGLASGSTGRDHHRAATSWQQLLREG